MLGLEIESAHVLLIGAGNYPNWPQMNIPNVAINMEELSSLLTNPDYCGIPSGQIKIVKDEDLENTAAVIYDFFDGIQSNKATVIIYYSGHGLQSTKAMDDLFLATKNIRENKFESSCIKISELRKLFSDCPAGRKILLLDCCYAGKITKGFLSDDKSDSLAKLSEFEGTYIMAASSEYERARFDPDNPHSPTKFTGKFVDVVKNGIETDEEYCTLNSIYNQIRISFLSQKDAPKPVQVGQNTVANLPIFKNKKFAERKTADEIAWEDAKKINTQAGFYRFKKAFPISTFVREADRRIDEMEDEQAWDLAKRKDTIGGYNLYISHYRSGKFQEQARSKLEQLIGDSPVSKTDAEEEVWKATLSDNSVESFNNYIEKYPNGKFVDKAQFKLNEIEVNLNDENEWKKVQEQNSLESYQKYINREPKGRFAQQAMDKIKEIEDDRWTSVCKENSIQAYSLYLQDFPQSNHKKNAYDKIKKLTKPPKGSALQKKSYDVLDLNDLSRDKLIKLANQFSITSRQNHSKQELIHKILDKQIEETKKKIPHNPDKKSSKKTVKNLLAFDGITARTWKQKSGWGQLGEGKMIINSDSIEFISNKFNTTINQVQEIYFQKEGDGFAWNYMVIKFIKDSKNDVLLFYKYVNFWEVGQPTKTIYNEIAALCNKGDLDFIKNMKKEV
ncbi:MAG TPA: caspase family protein [Chitinophagales bacterium]|nr:caspase family protein [Chitinophagales bacterium]